MSWLRSVDKVRVGAAAGVLLCVVGAWFALSYPSLSASNEVPSVRVAGTGEPLNGGPALAGVLTPSLVLAPEPVLVAELLWQPAEVRSPKKPIPIAHKEGRLTATNKIGKPISWKWSLEAEGEEWSLGMPDDPKTGESTGIAEEAVKHEGRNVVIVHRPGYVGLGSQKGLLVLAVTPKGPQPKEKVLEPSIEELIQRLLEVRAKRSELDKQEKEAVQALRKQMEALQNQLKQVGVLIDGDAPVVVTPPIKPVPVLPPVVPATPLDELTAAYRADRDGKQGTFEDLQALALSYRSAGEGMERTRPPTIGHLLGGLEVRHRVNLKGRLPRTLELCKQYLALKLLPSNTVLVPILPPSVKVEQSDALQASKQVLIELASLLERVTP